MSTKTTLVVGGTSGIGLELAKTLIARGEKVIITGRETERAQAIAADLGPHASGLGVDLSVPESIAESLKSVGEINGLVLAGILRDANTVRDYNIERAKLLVTLKLVGYTETVHTLLGRLPENRDTAIVLFGGRAKDAPYPGSTTVSSINGGVEGLTRTMALELAPMRVNAIHPGIIGNSPFWSDKPASVLDGYESRTPGGGLATMEDVVGATIFLLDNKGTSGTNIYVDRGWRLT
ncbi:MAG: SDR family NAD(P)-dependent oxidoreductase [Microbacteriaceae bacterium]